MTQNTFMEQAIINAYKGLDLGEVPVGCVIVNQDNKIISQSYNKVIADNDPTAHAEINAIRQACVSLKSERLIDCSIYVTLEPCVMCAAAISKSKLKRLYYGADDMNFGSINGGFNFFQTKNCNHVPEIYDSISKIQCENLINDFFKGKRP